MSFYGNGYGMGGGGQQQQLMISSSVSAVSLSMILGGYGLLAYTQKWFPFAKKSDTGTETGTTTTATTTDQTQIVVETNDLGGTRLITNGIYSMKVLGSSCGNQQVVFSKADGGKWLWNLKTLGYIKVDGQEVPVYSIESDYKLTREACDKRYLTAPDGCNSAPYLDAFRPMDFSQRWVLVKDTNNRYQIRSLLCAKDQQFNQFLIQSGGENNSKPSFSRGSGTPFEMPAASAGI